MKQVFLNHSSDLIHGTLVISVCLFATAYSIIINYRSDNIWAVYSAAIAFAAGRAGVAFYRTPSRATDPTSVTNVTGNEGPISRA